MNVCVQRSTEVPVNVHHHIRAERQISPCVPTQGAVLAAKGTGSGRILRLPPRSAGMNALMNILAFYFSFSGGVGWRGDRSCTVCANSTSVHAKFHLRVWVLEEPTHLSHPELSGLGNKIQSIRNSKGQTVNYVSGKLNLRYPWRFC